MNEFIIDENSNVPLKKEDIRNNFIWDSFSATFIFKSDFKYTKTLRDSVFNIRQFLKMDKLRISRLMLIVDELNNNSIEYWSKEGEYNKMIVNISKGKDLYINIEVIDTWNWKKAKTASEMEQLRNERLKKWFHWHDSIRWRGLFMIITRLVDELYFKDDINWWLVVWIKKTFKLS